MSSYKPNTGAALRWQVLLHESKRMQLMVWFFLDIRNFTTFCETHDAEIVIDRLNRLFSHCIDIVTLNGGIVNKFLGDGLLAVFGAPLSNGNDSENAIRSALEICKKVEQEFGSEKDILQIGIGIHYGNVIVGNVGSEDRKEYTVLGDAVNLASRMETLTKHFSAQIIATKIAVETSGLDLEHLRKLPLLRVKGRAEPVEAYVIH